MIRKIVIIAAAMCVLSVMGSAYWTNSCFADPEKKAAEIHAKALSDIIYVDSELIAHYYQNVKVISLLEEIKALLKENLEEMRSLRENTEDH